MISIIVCFVPNTKITISLGKKPNKGGSPPSERRNTGSESVVKFDFL